MNLLEELEQRKALVNQLRLNAQLQEAMGALADDAFMQWNTAWTELGDFQMTNRQEIRNLKIDLILGE